MVNEDFLVKIEDDVDEEEERGDLVGGSISFTCLVVEVRSLVGRIGRGLVDV